MSERLTYSAAVADTIIPTDHPGLTRLLKLVRSLPPMTPAQEEAQRRSWVVGEMMLSHPDMSRERAERIYDEVRNK